MGPAAAERRVDLDHWMQRALKEADSASQGFLPDPVHDLRVALRRCRSIAASFRSLDLHPAWKRMNKAAKEIFSRLGELRDVQVLAEWVERLGAPQDPVRETLLAFCRSREMGLKEEAMTGLQKFDRRRWDSWKAQLAKRVARVPLEGVVFEYIALQRWTDAFALHRKALRDRSKVGFHRLRIGLKKFRYIVENFLPARHKQWGSQLKELQDLLGEVHDLDVLWATALRIKAFPDPEARRRWRSRIEEERSRRIERYRALMVGRGSLWRTWRDGLPKGDQIEKGLLRKLEAWAASLDSDFAHTRRITRLGLQLLAGLAANGTFDGGSSARRLLQAAALVHHVGRAKGKKAYHKVSQRMICKWELPLGWTSEDLAIVSLVARYHRGALPNPRHRWFRRLSRKGKLLTTRLAAVLRLADAFDCRHDGTVRGLKVARNADVLVIEANSFPEDGPIAQKVATARYLLERASGLPILVRGTEKAGTGGARRTPKRVAPLSGLGR